MKRITVAIAIVTLLAGTKLIVGQIRGNLLRRAQQRGLLRAEQRVAAVDQVIARVGEHVRLLEQRGGAGLLMGAVVHEREFQIRAYLVVHIDMREEAGVVEKQFVDFARA